MKITVIQPDIIWNDLPGNLARIERLMAGTEDPDIVILPEMFTTGFSENTVHFSEPPFSATFTWMVRLSEKYNCGMCGSYPVTEKKKLYNRWIFVSPEKAICQYDKRHLFSMDGEESGFTPGRKRVTFSFRKVRILPLVCYDLRFPVWSRNRSDYDLLIISANWPVARRDVWITLLKARAIENQCYVAASNRIGTDGNKTEYCGESMIINPYGEIIGSANPEREESISAELSIEELEAFRKKFPVHRDADNFRMIP